MNEDVQKIGIEYDATLNRFVIILNEGAFNFSPNQYMEFVNHSIIAINNIIAERFSNSLKGFLGEERTKKKKTFTKKDSELIANEVEEWFKENPLSG